MPGKNIKYVRLHKRNVGTRTGGGSTIRREKHVMSVSKLINCI